MHQAAILLGLRPLFSIVFDLTSSEIFNYYFFYLLGMRKFLNEILSNVLTDRKQWKSKNSYTD